MIALTHTSGSKFALFGLGGSGLAAARILQMSGAVVDCWDDSEESRARAREAGLSVTDLQKADLSAYEALVLAPGVPLHFPRPHPLAQRANDAGVPIIGDIELFERERKHASPHSKLIAVTGTNGKSTTSALLTHLLKCQGLEVQLGGNIGLPALELAPFSSGAIYVLEISSFQIDLAPSLQPSIGLLTNLAPDHLDRHGTMDNYAAVKTRMIAASQAAVIGLDDEYSREVYQQMRGAKPCYGVSAEASTEASFFFGQGKIFQRSAKEVKALYDLEKADHLRGAHNGQNASAAIAALALLGENKEPKQADFESFLSLPHRLQRVGKLGKIVFFNDSKATNPPSTVTALKAFSKTRLILGGKPKEGGLAALEPYFGRITKAYLIGESEEAFAGELTDKVSFARCGTLERAFAAAVADAQASDEAESVILLSPAAASYDQFKSFAHRGEAFTAMVNEALGQKS